MRLRDSLQIDVLRGADAITMELTGPLDHPGAEQLGRRLDALQLQGTLPLRLDLSGVTFVDSAGLRAVLRLYGRCLKAQRDLSIVPAPENVQRVFSLTKAADVLPFEASLIAA